MPGYDLLDGVRVVEVAKLGPSALGGYLADMGADVVKVEVPGDGDPVRFSGPEAVGEPGGFGLLHLRWNRGKRSAEIDLKTDEGKAVFRRLASRAHIVIEGMRAGILDRLGLGYDVLKQDNPALVYCSVSGFGLSGAYSSLGAAGPFFDSFGGLLRSAGETEVENPRVPVGMHAVGLYSAVGTLAALRRAERTGVGCKIEVAAADCAAHWLPTGADVELTRDAAFERPGYNSSEGKMAKWPRMHAYRTRDDSVVIVQLLAEKFWQRLCTAVDRPDLIRHYEEASDPELADAQAFELLTELFGTRTRAEWMAIFLEHDVPGAPVNTVAELIEDPHFLDRQNTYEVTHPSGRTFRLTGTPIRVDERPFAPDLAPHLGADTEDVLRDFGGYDDQEIKSLRESGAIA